MSTQECTCSLIHTCDLCRNAEPYRIDTTTGAAVPAPFNSHDDVNPICGCHKGALCLGCGSCTTCDGCYCEED